MTRLFLAATAALLLTAFLVAGPAAAGIHLSSVPAKVYKIADPGRARTESWYFNLVVSDDDHREKLKATQAVIEVFTGEQLRETWSLPDSTLKRMATLSYKSPSAADPAAPKRPFVLDEAFDLRLSFSSRPISFKADRVRVTLTLDVPGEGSISKSLDVPLAIYQQKTELLFPLKQPAIVTQGQINNAGHAGHSNQFAIDVMGLNAEYGPMVTGRTGNEEFAGWGMEILAPAAGTVVYSRNDVPDNPPDGEPADIYMKLPDPVLATAGNCVIIDHGNGEYSALMHMQLGSVLVVVGDKVTAGQPVGKLGQSGDAFGVHLHYQLQDGPKLFSASSLPVTFKNVRETSFSRGAYLTPH